MTQIIRQCDQCGREQYDSHLGGICDRCGGTWILAPLIKRCPLCGSIFSVRHHSPHLCQPVTLTTIPQGNPTPGLLELLRLNEPPPKPCPFCDSNDFHDYVRSDRGSKEYRSCRECGAEAPIIVWDKWMWDAYAPALRPMSFSAVPTTEELKQLHAENDILRRTLKGVEAYIHTNCATNSEPQTGPDTNTIT